MSQARHLIDSHGSFICPSDVTPLFQDNSYKKVHGVVYENVGFWCHLEWHLITGLLHNYTEFGMEKKCIALGGVLIGSMCAPEDILKW